MAPDVRLIHTPEAMDELMRSSLEAANVRLEGTGVQLDIEDPGAFMVRDAAVQIFEQGGPVPEPAARIFAETAFMGEAFRQGYSDFDDMEVYEVLTSFWEHLKEVLFDHHDF
jgi:hypothetical protein